MGENCLTYLTGLSLTSDENFFQLLGMNISYSIYMHTWNPNDPAVLNGVSLGLRPWRVLSPQNRGSQTGSRYLNIFLQTSSLSPPEFVQGLEPPFF